MALGTLDLPKNEVHLWFAFPEEIRDPSLLSQYHRFLNADEAVQQRRFHFEKHRHQYLITRALVRAGLSRYLPNAPGDWVFEKNKYGRPEIAPHLNPGQLRFNLSHSDGLIVLAVVWSREIGVDVEFMDRGGGLIEIADRFFSPTEVRELNTQPDSEKTHRFFDYWTLKESYIKARGMGLSIPLDHFSFILGEGSDISITIDPRQNDQPQRWQFRQWLLAESRHKAALTLERHANRVFQVKLFKTVPLVSQKVWPLPVIHDSFDA